MKPELLDSGLWVTELLLVVLVLVAAVTDLKSRRIPNLLVLAGLIVAFVVQVFLPMGMGWQGWLYGMLTGFAVFFPLYLLRGMAAGDVKLMAAVGAFVGWSMALKIALLTCVAGGVMSVLYIVVKGRVRQAWDNICMIMLPMLMRKTGVKLDAVDVSAQSVGRIPYAVAIAVGTAIALYLKHTLV